MSKKKKPTKKKLVKAALLSILLLLGQYAHEIYIAKQQQGKPPFVLKTEPNEVVAERRAPIPAN